MKTILILCFAILMTVAPAYALDYYVDAINGNDSSSGTDISLPLRTIAKVNGLKLKPGDRVNLKRGAEWRESLMVPASGEPGKEIVFTAYGDGPNPAIRCSNTFAEWGLAYDSKGAKVWRGTMPGIRNSWGAMRHGKRLPAYLEYPYASPFGSPRQIGDMRNEFFYAPLHSSTFYYRCDAGNPGVLEVGARRYGIYLNQRQYVTIDHLDVYGPGGASNGGSAAGELIRVESSENITIKNCTVAHSHDVCVNIIKSSKDCRLVNIIAFDSKGTAIYFSRAGENNTIINSEVYDCGNLVSDSGDMGLIGIWKAPGVIIDKCYLHDNGHKGAEGIDAAVSFVQSPNGTLSYSSIINAGGTAVQFAENSDYGTAAYNIIDRWGVYGNGFTKGAHAEGLRIGGGQQQSTARGCRIFNNLFVHGGITPGEYASLRTTFHANAGLEVKNNIFLNNRGVYEIYAESVDNFQNWSFSNNCFYRTSGKAIKIAGRVYDHDHILGPGKGFYSFDLKQERDSISADPKLAPDLRSLKPDSPCLSRGVWAGFSRDFHRNPELLKQRVNMGPFEVIK